MVISWENRVIAVSLILALVAGVTTQVLLEAVGITGTTPTTVASAVVIVVGVVLPQIIIRQFADQRDSARI